jgi:hypothetical protein
MNADRFVPESRWDIVTSLKNDKELAELDELVNRTVPRKAFSMKTNKLIFNHVLLVSERQKWRSGMARLHPIGKVALDKGFLARFQTAAVDRVRLALHPKGLRKLMPVDPNGKQAQKSAMVSRNELMLDLPPGPERDAQAERQAAEYLVGMQSPP